MYIYIGRVTLLNSSDKSRNLFCITSYSNIYTYIYICLFILHIYKYIYIICIYTSIIFVCVSLQAGVQDGVQDACMQYIYICIYI